MTLVSAVILAYQEEPFLEDAVKALLASTGVDVEVLVVDNGCTSDAVRECALLSGVTVVGPFPNIGFAAGCNAGAREARGEIVALINGDAVVAPTALAHLAEVALQPDVGIASASIRLADSPERLNSRGNDVHFLGFSWSGGFGEPAANHSVQQDVTAASGAGLAIRRALWESLRGFEERYFIYAEDLEMSLRCWQRGLRVVYVPDAVIYHHYEFSRNPQKYFLLERNRGIVVLSLLEARTLALLGPALLATELGIGVLALRGGWWPQKAQSWAWLWHNRRWLRSRRRSLQAERTVADRDLATRFVSRLDPRNLELPSSVRPLNCVLAAYWSVTRRLL
jgi:GT2 family glycosyltransferase